jgi:glycosyltransferase involved in cell wall biosynthesis
MMNETHAGTARAVGVAARLKRMLLSLFDSALVGGEPQKRYFASLGMPKNRIFPGYDSVDNDYFARQARAHRLNRADLRQKYDLPESFLLSLGRFVVKKNLETLLHAYRRYLDSSPLSDTHLVMIGSGPEEAKLKRLCGELGLPVYDKAKVGRDESFNGVHTGAHQKAAGVHFYGFRQIDENSVFFALAEAFVLPSLYEEWGLVVNEAMASGLPIIVSQTAGCAEDLVEPLGGGREDFSDAVLPFDNKECRLRICRNGFVFNPRSLEELAGIFLYLESHPDTRALMAEESTRIVEKVSCEDFGRNALLAAHCALNAGQPAAGLT